MLRDLEAELHAIADRNLAAREAAARLASPGERLLLLLASPERDMEREPGQKPTEQEQLQHTVLHLVDVHARNYLIRLWRRRAELLGGVPALDKQCRRLVLTQLREDGRCASFASPS